MWRRIAGHAALWPPAYSRSFLIVSHSTFIPFVLFPGPELTKPQGVASNFQRKSGAVAFYCRFFMYYLLTVKMYMPQRNCAACTNFCIPCHPLFRIAFPSYRLVIGGDHHIPRGQTIPLLFPVVQRSVLPHLFVQYWSGQENSTNDVMSWSPETIPHRCFAFLHPQWVSPSWSLHAISIRPTWQHCPCQWWRADRMLLTHLCSFLGESSRTSLKD